MDVQQQGILALMKSAVTGEAVPLPAEFDLNEAYKLIEKYKIAPLIHEGALNSGISQQQPVMLRLFQSSCRAIQVHERQMRAIEKLCARFEESGIAYMPLKGILMKALYPRPELRLMGDADILVRKEQYDQAIAIVKELGYVEKASMEHVSEWNGEALYLEVHTALFPEYEKTLHAHFANVWHAAKQVEKQRYAMTPDDTFVYKVAHFAKHFRGTGIGCRQMLDLWVYLRSHPDMNEAYIRNELEKLRIWTFYQNVRRTIAWWFEDALPDETTELISGVIFDNGNWGSVQSNTIAEAMISDHTAGSVTSKLLYGFRRLFPNAEIIKKAYPAAEKHPWMMPVFRVCYFAKKLLVRNHSLKHHMKKMSFLTDEKLDDRRKLLQDVGLDNYM